MSATAIRIIGLHSSWWDLQIKSGEMKLVSVYNNKECVSCHGKLAGGAE